MVAVGSPQIDYDGKQTTIADFEDIDILKPSKIPAHWLLDTLGEPAAKNHLSDP